MNLITYKNDDGLEIIIDTNTGESFCSIQGYARLSGITPSAISKRVQKLSEVIVSQPLIKSAELPTTKGLRTVSLLTEDLIVEWLVEDNPEQAKNILKLGVRKYMHTVANYNPKPELSKPTLEEAKFVADYIQSVLKGSTGKQIALKVIANAVPSCKGILEEAKVTVSLENAVDSKNLYSPSDIAVVLDLPEYKTAQKVNKLLESLGLQTKPRKKWKATPKARGLDLCCEIESTAPIYQQNNKYAGKELRWKAAIIDYIMEHI